MSDLILAYLCDLMSIKYLIMKSKYVVLFYFLITTATVFAQTPGEINDSKHDDCDHMHHSNELGVANAPVYYVKEKELTYGLHLHLVHSFADSKFGIGIGYERIFDEHKHNTVGLVVSYRATEAWSINAAPGITFEDNAQPNVALHLETVYEFEIKDFHVGPVFEVAYDPEDYHISLGIHIGYGF